MKITADILARLTRRARRITAGAYGITTTTNPGTATLTVTDTKADLTFTGLDALRQAAAFYAGLIDHLTDTTPGPVLAVLADVSERHGTYVDDGRRAAEPFTASTRVGAA